MSRRTLKFHAMVDTGGEEDERRDYTAVAGWDRPLGRLHLTIYAYPSGDMVWDCLHLPHPEQLTVTLIALIVQGMTHLDITDWLSMLRYDVAHKTGNEVTTHAAVPRASK